MPPQFLSMLRVETRAVVTRAAGLAALAVAVVVPVLLLAGLAALKFKLEAAGDAQQNQMLAQYFQGTAADAAGLALRARNFFVLPMFLLLATGGTLAGELADHTLRELLVRPVPRWSVVVAKFGALMALSLATLVLTGVPAVLGSLLLFPEPGALTDLALGFAASALSDAGLIALGLLVGTIVRGTGGVVVAVVFGLMIDVAARGVMFVLAKVGFPQLDAVRELLPGSALAAWEGWTDGFQTQPFVGLGLLLVVGLGGAILRLQRMDVP